MLRMRPRVLSAQLKVLLAAAAAVFTTVSLVGATGYAAAAGPIRDIVFSLDSSGSIDATDWQLQKTGYATALQDTVAFPRDGSIAVGVNQWSGTGQVRVEVALTVIRSQADADSIRNAIQAMTQYGGSTNPVLGLDNAVQMLSANGRNGSIRSICMSSDGTQNVGTGSITASAAAASSAGVKRFSVIGIEDGGNGAALGAYYRPAVFGGGSFTLAGNTAEFANLIVSGCLNDPIEVIGMEVTQGVQNWRNSIQLVAGRATVVRVFVQVPANANNQRVTGRLIGRKGATKLGTLAAQNPGGSILVKPNITSRRANWADSFRFDLPASWRSGNVELEFEGAGTSLSCLEAAEPSGQAKDCKVAVSFNAGSALKLKMVSLSYPGGTAAPGKTALNVTGKRIQSGMPASSVTISTKVGLKGKYQTTTSNDAILSDALALLAKQRAADGCGANCTTIYFGQFSGKGNGDTLGMGRIGGNVGAEFDWGLAGANDTGYGRSTAIHEFGHVIGLEHAVHDPVVTDNRGSWKYGNCGERAKPSAPNFLYFDSAGKPLMQPVGAATDDQIWGFDTRLASKDANKLAVVSPIGSAPAYEVMSYCFGGAPQETWPSDITWNAARASLAARFGTTVSLSAASQSTTLVAEVDRLLFAGVIDATAGTATIGSPVLVSATPPTPAGPYELRLIGNGGNVLGSAAFTPDDLSGKPDLGGTDSGADQLAYSVILDRPASPIEKVQIWNGTNMIAEKAASAAVPSVTISAPATGQDLTGETLHIAWTGADTDGDTVTYHVRYSPDGGATWQALALDFDGTSLDVPTSDLAGGTDAIIEVQAVDGLNLGSARVGPFTVVDGGPEVTIDSPHDNDAFYSGVQQVLLEANAQDLKDGDVSSSIVWTSDRDGRILSGPDGSIGADQLSEGQHVLTATARDADGRTGTASLRITVVRVAPPPSPEPEPSTSADPSATPTPGSTSPGGELGKTGQSVITWVIVGLSLIAGGVAIVVLSRRRRLRER